MPVAGQREAGVPHRFGTVPLGALLAGALGDALTVRAALWITLAIDALSWTLLLTPALRRDRDLPSHMAAGH